MKKLSLLMFAFGACAFIAGSTNYNKTPKKKLDEQYIVVLKTELEEGQGAVLASHKQFKRDLINTLGYDFKITDSFQHALNAVVVNVNANDKTKLESIPNVERVTKNETYFFAPDEMTTSGSETLDTGTPINGEIVVDPSINYSAETMNVPTTTKGGEGVLVAVLDSGFLLNHNAFTGLDEGVTPRYTKEQMKAIFDKHPEMSAKWTDGVDVYEDSEGKLIEDKDLNTYFNSKIAFQYDYSGIIYTDIEDGAQTSWTPGPDGELRKLTEEEVDADFCVPDGNAYTPYSDHGSHVAGIIAAHDKTTYAPKTYDGIAPNAQLALMKVFTEYIPKNGIQTGPDVEYPQMPGIGANDTHILKALEDCLILDVDMINMSLGQDLNDFDTKSESFKAFENLRKNGTLVNVSAGNNGRQLFALMGPYGSHNLDSVETGTMGSYANSEDVMTIGSGNLTVQHFERAIMVDGDAIAYDDQASKEKNEELTEDLPLEKLNEFYPDKKGIFEYEYIPNDGEKTDYEGLDLKGKIAVVNRGGTTFTSKIAAAKANEAIAIIVVDNTPATEFNMRMDLTTMDGSIGIPVVMVLNKDKAILENAKNKQITVITNKDVANPNIGKMSEFSTDGATYDLRLKPEITAPGSVIKGPVPGKPDYSNDMKFNQDKTKYDWLSGTSMSSPNYTGAGAVALSEFSTDRAARKAYAMTLPARTMSTATIETSEIRGQEQNHNLEGFEGTPYSPRRQGAGFVDVSKTIESKLYLEGQIKNKAKIELFNTKDIAEGKISLEFTVHNETGKQVEYTPKVLVLRPDIVTYDEKPTQGKDPDDPPKYEFEEWLGKDLQSINDKLVQIETLQNIVVGPEATTNIKLPTVNVKTELLNEINEKFPNGTYLEGFVILEPTASSSTTEGVTSLNIPYMGFYGDYFAQEPVEKFDFERKEGEFLGSDLIHTVAKKVGLEFSDYGSYIRGVASKSLSDERFYDNMNSMWTNKQSIKDFTNELTYDPEKNAIHAGGKDKTDLLFIQMFVNRSINETSISLTKDGDPTRTDYAQDVFGDNRPRFYSPLYGASMDQIAKSMVTMSYANGPLAHRAYGLLPLNNLTDGTYHLTMRFKIQAANMLGADHVTSDNRTGWYTKTVDIIIDNSAPEIHHTEVIEVEGTSYLRVYITEKYLRDITFNGGFIMNSLPELDAQSGLYYTQAPIDEIFGASEDGKLFVTIEDESYNVSKFVTNIGEKGEVGYFLSATWMRSGYTHNLTVKEIIEDGVKSYVYHIEMLDVDGNVVKVSNTNQITVTIDVSDFKMAGYQLFRVDEETGIRMRIKNSTYDESAQTLTFKTKGNTFELVAEKVGGDTPVDPEDPDVPPVDPDTPVTPENDGNNLGLILGISIPAGVLVVAGAVVLVLVLKKKRG